MTKDQIVMVLKVEPFELAVLYQAIQSWISVDYDGTPCLRLRESGPCVLVRLEAA